MTPDQPPKTKEQIQARLKEEIQTRLRDLQTEREKILKPEAPENHPDFTTPKNWPIAPAPAPEPEPKIDQTRKIKRVEPTVATNTTENPEEAGKAQALAALRETIANAQATLQKNQAREQEILKRLAEIKNKKGASVKNAEASLSIDALKTNLASLKKKYEETSMFRVKKLGTLNKEILNLQKLIREREEAERLEREKEAKEKENQERREAIEKDKKENPLKYLIIDKMGDQAFELLFRKEKGEVSLEEINKKMGESGKEVRFLNFNYILPVNNYTVHITSNGFSLQLLNIEECKDKNGKLTDAMWTKGKYKLVYPDWTSKDGELSYENGTELLRKRAEEYQAQQIAEFEIGTPEGVKKLIEEELAGFKKYLQKCKENRDEYSIGYTEEKIKLLESDPIKYFTEQRDDAQSTLNFVSTNQKYLSEHTKEENRDSKIQQTQRVERFQRIIDTLKKSTKK